MFLVGGGVGGCVGSDSMHPRVWSGKRSTQRARDVCDESVESVQAQTHDVDQAESGTRRFLRLCYFPVLWMHEYKRVVLFLNVPQKFQETDAQLRHRMVDMVLKYGRLNLQSCNFHSSVHDMIWSIEAGRKKRVITPSA